MQISKEELQELLEELEKYKARATELITVYIPTGQNIYTVADQLEAEKSTAKNIKSTSTRKNVSNALDKITRQLKEYKKTPENGLAIFCGNISKVEGQDDLKLWAIEPMMPLKTRMYRCAKEFVLEPLKEMLEVTEVFGLLVMDRKEATIGLLEGKRIETLQKMTSGVPSKVRAGGQCLSPEMIVETKKGTKRIKDIEIGEELTALDIKSYKIIFTKVKKKWKVTNDKYLIIKISDCWDIICSKDHIFFKDIGKEDWNIIEVLAKDLKIGDFPISFDQDKKIVTYKIANIKENKKPMEMIDIETEAKNFFVNGILVHNSSQRFHRITEGLTKEFYKRVAEEMKSLFFTMPKLKGIIVGGPIPTKDEFLEGEYLTTNLRQKVLGKIDVGDSSESGLKELVEKSNELLANHERTQEKKDIENFFQNLGENPEKTVLGEKDTRRALELGAVNILFLSAKLSKNLLKELKELAANIGADVKVISTDTTEGEQFYNMGGIGAILRFRI